MGWTEMRGWRTRQRAHRADMARWKAQTARPKRRQTLGQMAQDPRWAAHNYEGYGGKSRKHYGGWGYGGTRKRI